MSVDLTAIKTPFGLLDDATRAMLVTHGGPYERFFGGPSCGGPRWIDDGCSAWWATSTYRVKPAPAPIPMTVPWHQFTPEVRWAAVDADGEAFLFAGKPRIVDDMWIADDREIPADLVIGFERGTVHWRDSLQERPEGV